MSQPPTIEQEIAQKQEVWKQARIQRLLKELHLNAQEKAAILEELAALGWMPKKQIVDNKSQSVI
jgi:hypothetical protein